MKRIAVNLGKRSYHILVGKGVINRLSKILMSDYCNPPVFVITNRKIKKLHGASLKKALEPVSTRILFYEVPNSEKSKSFPVYIKTIRRLARFAKKTKPVVIAFGGGVVGDLAGFVASAYRRGVPYVQVPTTLLAQVDSSVGGKVAIDIKEAKNIVGNFYQPKAVLCDLSFLKTLPKKELRNGLAEVVKYGVIKRRPFFSFLKKNMKKILQGNPKTLERIVFTCCTIKARVVEQDEYDTLGLRAILNFGHTIGHAIEAASGYSSRITHGEAVAAGMTKASLIAVKRKLMQKSDYEKIKELTEKLFPKSKIKKLPPASIMSALSYDKKFIRGTSCFILPVGIGSVRVVDDIPQALIRKVIENDA